MKTLLKLARLINAKEQRSIADELRSMGYTVTNDPWDNRNRLIVESEFATEVDGVVAAIPLEVYDAETITLKDVVQLVKRVAPEEYSLDAHIFPGTPFHARALRDRLKPTNTGNTVYIEAKPAKNCVLVRIGIVASDDEPTPDVTLVLESPKTPYEVADFLRLGIAFHCDIHISSEGDLRTLHALEEAKKIVKGSVKTKVRFFKTTREAIGTRRAIAFSLWGKKGERFLDAVTGDVALVFGNEERGLKLSTVKSCEASVRLGPKSSEPLRASQAAAYALGVMKW